MEFRITELQQKQIDALVLAKYGKEKHKQWKEGSLLINDKEISNITGIVTYKVPVGGLSYSKAKKFLKKIMSPLSKKQKTEADKYRTYEIKPNYNKPDEEELWVPCK